MRTILKTSLVAIALLIGVSASAQDTPITFGVKVGANLSNFSGDLDMDAKFGFNAGVTLDYAFTPDVYLLTGLEFTTKGAKRKTGDNSFTMNPMYLQLPIHVGYKLTVADNTRLVFHAGPYVAYGLGGKTTTKTAGIKTKGDFFGSEKDGGYKRFDFGVGLGVGAEFGKINVGLGYDFGLLNIARGGYEGSFDLGDFGTIEIESSDYKVRNMNAYLTVGYKF
ncbi:PorT family protein [Dysgonomonas sp. OttesenSCG-928-D17]|nr:PorT family protein [Dysgonomonas sp. OttesenSCG-928-D17]